MLVAAVAAILDRDLQALAREVEAYPDERTLWETPPGIPNPGGVPGTIPEPSSATVRASRVSPSPLEARSVSPRSPTSMATWPGFACLTALVRLSCRQR